MDNSSRGCMNNVWLIDIIVFFQEAHRIATTVLVEEIGADPLCKFNADECAALARELHIQLPEGGGCTITHAIRRGPAFEELSVELFASRWHLHNAPRCLDQLIDEDISDDAVSSVCRCDSGIEEYSISHLEVLYHWIFC